MDSGDVMMAVAARGQASVRCIGLIIVALGVTVPVAAHDFWIEPTSYVPEVGRFIGIRARVGDGFLGDPVPRDPLLLEQLVVEDASGRRPVIGRDGADPAGLLRVGVPGLHVVGYFGKPSRVELAADKFNTYLHDEGLDGVAAARARLNQSESGARELFTRCAKTLVLVGAASPDQRDRVLGCTLELVAERNPYALEPGQALPVRLTYEGRPIEGALVVARSRQRASDKISARSDRDGRVKLVLPAGGTWLIKAVHMIPAPAAANADWASYWASLTFELPVRPATMPASGGRS
jgi:Domain of unknown function (DUF4198)